MEAKKLTRALDEAKKRMAKAQKSQHTAEVAAAEARGKVDAASQGGKIEVALAQQALEMARRDSSKAETELKDYKARAQALELARRDSSKAETELKDYKARAQALEMARRDSSKAETELKDYKSRAQALLKAKEEEIREIRESTAALTSSCISAEEGDILKKQLQETRTALHIAEERLMELEDSHSNEKRDLLSQHDSENDALQGRVAHFTKLAADAQKELEEWKHK
eukprot:gene14942-20997_t